MSEQINALFWQDFYEAKKLHRLKKELPSLFTTLFSYFIFLKESSVSFSKERTPRNLLNDPILNVDRCFEYLLLCNKHLENIMG